MLRVSVTVVVLTSSVGRCLTPPTRGTRKRVVFQWKDSEVTGEGTYDGGSPTVLRTDTTVTTVIVDTGQPTLEVVT